MLSKKSKIENTENLAKAVFSTLLQRQGTLPVLDPSETLAVHCGMVLMLVSTPIEGFVLRP
jgi:hypothetical protein